MSFSYVQSIDTYSVNNLTLNGVGADNLLVAFVTAGGSLVNITVSGGGTWVALSQCKNNSWDSYVKLYYCLSATGGNSTFSLSNSATDVGWGVLEFSKSGSALYDSLTNTTTLTGNSDIFSSGNITVNNNNSLMVSCLSDEYEVSNPTWDTGWVEVEENLSHMHSCAYRIIDTSGTYTSSGTRTKACPNSALSTLVFYESGVGASLSIPVLINQFRLRRN